MKKLLAVLCFVPVGLVALIFVSVLLDIVGMMVHVIIKDPLSALIGAGIVAGMALIYVVLVYGISKLSALGARLWGGDKPKNGYVLIDGEWYPASVEFGETMKSINSHLHKNKEDSCSTK